MDTAVLVARLVIAAIFLIAAIGKLLDLQGSRRSLVEFGVPARAASIGGTLLPLAELAIAIALIVQPWAQWGGVAALVLMLAFVGGISNALARGRQPDCNCFGALHSGPAGRRTLARNSALALASGFVAIQGPGPSVTAWVAARSALELVAIAAGIAIAALGAICARAIWDNRRLRRELGRAEETVATIPPGLRVGTMAPSFSVPDGDGGNASLDSLRAHGLPVLLVFVRAGCGPSEGFLPELERLRETLADKVTIGVVGSGSVARYATSPSDSLGAAREHDPLLDQELEGLLQLFDAYRLPATPSAVLVTPQGAIASATVDGRLAILSLLRLTLARSAAIVRSVASNGSGHMTALEV